MKKIIMASLVLSSAVTFASAMLPNAYTVNGSSLGVPQQGEMTQASNVQGQTMQNVNALGTVIAVTSEVVLKYGDRGMAVKELQMSLNKKGAKLPVTGYYGKMTRAAVAMYK